MAKIKHNHFLDTIDEVIGHAKAQGVVHLHAEGHQLSGRHLTIGGSTLCHFGTTGYLGLEQDVRLKEAAKSAIDNYGTQFPLSKTYISHPLYATLEAQLQEMYGLPILITKNSTLGHIAVIPSAVRDEDAIILDHQVHWSVQQASQLLKLRGVPVQMIRHNSMDMLEDRIKRLSGTHRKIWYMADGVYSMFGDSAPIADLKALSQKYPQLHIYYDDVHGMSWTGLHGTGFIMDAYGELPENVLLFGTLSKTFGASGAFLVCPDKALHRQIKNFGGPLTFSAQLEPSAVAAAVASAKIHLSDEINELQGDLYEKILYFNVLLEASGLPLIETNDTPVFYIGTGMPATGYNFVKRMMDAGFFVNLGLYPAVPVKNTGVRITISRHNTESDIYALVQAMVYHYPRALEDTGTTKAQVYGLFKKEFKEEETAQAYDLDLLMYYKNSIEAVDQELWDAYMGYNCFDWEGLRFLESVFKERPEVEHCWEFHYFIIKDRYGDPLVMTFFTSVLIKDDMLAKEAISKHIEVLRQSDPYYLTSRVMSMGSLFTEGAQCYIRKENALWPEAMRMVLDVVEGINSKEQIGTTMLRDFDADDEEMKQFCHDQGFIKSDLPDSSKLTELPWLSIEEYVASLSKKSRRHYKTDIAPYISKFTIAFKAHLSTTELKYAYDLYKEVKSRNYGLNTFTYPFALFERMNAHPLWEFIVLQLNDEDVRSDTPMVGVMFCYKNEVNRIYVPSLIGMDYDFVGSHQIYRQLLFQTIGRAMELNYSSIDFGVTAAFEKRKVGAKNAKIVAYVQAEDNYAMEVVEGFEGVD